MAYTECLVIELSNPYLREDALLVHSKVLLNYPLFFCPFLMSYIGFTINQNLFFEEAKQLIKILREL